MTACSCETAGSEFSPLHPSCLGELWIFQGLAQRDAQALVEGALRKRRSKGEQIFLQGDPAGEMFLLKAGLIKLTRLLPDGAEITLDIRGPGAVVGETALTEESAYPLSAWCMEDCLTCGFTRDTFESLVVRHPGIGLQVIRNMSARIAYLTDQLEATAVTGLEERLLRVLTNLAREHGKPENGHLFLPFSLTHEELGFLVGAHRVSVTRALGNLRTNLGVRTERHGMVLPLPRE